MLRFRSTLSRLGLFVALVGAPMLAFAQAKPATPEAKTEAKPAVAATSDAKPASPRVLMKTSLGEITVELNAEKAPKSVENFLQYVKDGFYDGTVFHRVIANFMIQGGGFTPDLRQKPTRPSIANEAKNGLSNKRGTIAMARTSDPNSATAQFFINTVDNRNLDYVSDERAETWGYAVFGQVVSGMDVVDAIRSTATGPKGPFRGDVPMTDVVIEKVTVLE
ncbi:peptidylprolyl isomerase [Dokdonella sp. MW10]|uniref:peptidylprolyl isomerase n=1 Tax=Dokdonella sp. MW10 TaxID=2992926 RepID=UPI003F7D3E44